jgi:hypothetical protein
MTKTRDKKIINFPKYSNSKSNLLREKFNFNHVNFNTNFFLWFFLEPENIDLLSRFINAVLYDMHYEPLMYITGVYSLENENLKPHSKLDTDSKNKIYSILIDAKTDKGNFRQIVILPYEKPLSVAGADKLCANAYLDFSDISPSPMGKRALHFLFLLNHPFIDARDVNGLLKTDFHIVNSPKSTELDNPFQEGEVVLHYLQFPLFYDCDLKKADMDLIYFMSVFILSTRPETVKIRNLFRKLDSGMNRIWEGYKQYTSK